MPYWSLQKLAAKTAPSLEGTSVYELPSKGLLSTLIYYASASYAEATTPDTLEKWRIIDALTKVEVILNGTYDAKSITGQVAGALSAWDLRMGNVEWWRAYAMGMTRCSFPIMFGVKPYDPKHFLDLAKYDNVELKITNDMDSDTWGAAPSEAIYALMYKEAPAGISEGYFRTREWRKWTTESDEWKYLDLPTEDLLRRVILQALPPTTDGAEDTTMWNLMRDIEYKMRSGDVVMFDAGLAELMRLNAYDYGHEVLYGGAKYTTDDYAFPSGLGRIYGMGIAEVGQDAVNADHPTSIEDRPEGDIKVRQGTGSTLMEFIARGVAPYHTAVFRHDRMPDLSDLLDLAAEKTVELNIHTREGSTYAGGTNRVVLETLVK